MKKIISVILLSGLMTSISAAPVIYKGVNKQTSSDRYQHHHYPNQTSHHPSKQYYPYNNRAQVAVVTPNVQIYVTPQPQYHYQKTEEVYLPYGGTYRKTTEYLPQSQYRMPVQVAPPSRVVIGQGQYLLEQQ